ncbi:helix-turn-helix domain-containing protein [Allomesorhizobium alhagi]|uniref:HTH cro/C1-type domain-containing protein n=1 Tax=Mesorhizobium alhagi CCNWXJ12-2 TaxID=1107882 RepID=H0HNK6_9HYPH|nr:helix-turn-helix transcriptional regulator [Mesorhizobium alhagi]EHK57659.1 hypothetical protein MAXJ12_08644 [Mesorhizobium alhagi CCNWXJ12-2]
MDRGLPDTSKESIGQRLARVREALGWNQSTLATSLGMSTQRWNNYEKGKTLPPPDVLAKFWQTTGATSDYILFGRRDGMSVELIKKLDAQQRAQRGSGSIAG